MQVPAIRERMVASLANVSRALAEPLAQELGLVMPKPLPKAMRTAVKPEVTVSPSLSLLARPGDGRIAGGAWR